MHAYQELSRTIEIQPENYEAHIDLANLLIAGHDLKQAQEHTDLVLQKAPNNPQAHVAAANLLAAQNDLPDAMKEVQKAIELSPGEWEPYLNLAMFQMRSNQADAAETNFKKAIELNPKAMNAELALGAYYESRNRPSEAEQQFNNAIAIAPKDPEPRAALARLYLAEGKKAEAEEFLKKAKADFPDNSAGYRMLGDFYFATGDVDKATAEYAALYQQHPKDTQLKKNYIQLLILKGQLDEARKLNDEILKGNAEDEEALIFRGQIQIRDGHANDATQTLQTAIKNDPDNAVAHYHLGMAFEQLGDLARAESEWQNAVRIHPQLIEAQRALAALELLKRDMPALEQTANEIISIEPDLPRDMPSARCQISIVSNLLRPSRTRAKRLNWLRNRPQATCKWEIYILFRSNFLPRKRLSSRPWTAIRIRRMRLRA